MSYLNKAIKIFKRGYSTTLRKKNQISNSHRLLVTENLHLVNIMYPCFMITLISFIELKSNSGFSFKTKKLAS